MRKRSVEKVSAFITRYKDNKIELLVFEHPTAGIQIPAGTTEIFEPVETALFREVREETGLHKVNIVSELGVIDRQLNSNKAIILRGTKLFNTPEVDASSHGYFLDRGLIVCEIKRVGQFSEVLCDPLFLDDHPARRIKNVTGYIRSSILGKEIIRHLFHLTTEEITADQWRIQTDGHEFRLFWTELRPKPGLVDPQTAWLDKVYDKLVNESSI